MRRFIAGAVCPKCRAMDRLVIETMETGRRRRCVSCGHTDAEDENLVPEPSTRLDTRGRPETPAAAVRILVPPGSPNGAEKEGIENDSPEKDS